MPLPFELRYPASHARRFTFLRWGAAFVGLAASLVTFACGSSATPEDAAVGADGGLDGPSSSPSSVVLVSPTLDGTGIVALAPGPDDTLLALSSVGNPFEVNTAPLPITLSRIDANGKVLWSRPIGQSLSPDQFPFATVSATRIVIGDSYRPDLSKESLRVLDENGMQVTSLPTNGRITGLASRPNGVIGVLEDSTDRHGEVFVWSGQGAIASVPVVAQGDTKPVFYSDLDSLAVDGVGDAWVIAEKGVARLETSGALRTFPSVVLDPFAGHLFGKPKGGVLAFLHLPADKPIVSVSSSGDIEKAWEYISPLTAASRAFAISGDGRLLHFSVADRNHPSLAIRDLEGNRTKDLAFSYDGYLTSSTYAAGKVWAAGTFSGKFELGSVALKSAPNTLAPWLLGFDRYETLIPEASGTVCKAKSSLCADCANTCKRCADIADCPAGQSQVCACSSPDAFTACLGTGYSSQVTADFVDCYTNRCAEACGVGK
jgi:hypothetical protein